MNKIKKRFFLYFILISTNLLFFPVYSQDETKNIIIKEVKVRGIKAAPRNQINNLIREIKGKNFSKILLINSTKKLFSLGFFEDIQIEIEEFSESVIVHFYFEEKKKN